MNRTRGVLFTTLFICSLAIALLITCLASYRRSNNATKSSPSSLRGPCISPNECGKKPLNFRLADDDEDEDRDESEKIKRWTFRIAQIADLHYGEAENTTWGPVQDKNSTRVIESILQSEPLVDLVILSGDQITANNIDANATAYYRHIIDTMMKVNPNISWAMIFGNHDDAPLQRTQQVHANGTALDNVAPHAKTTRDDLLRLDMSYNGSYTRAGPRDIFGRSNYVVPLFIEDREHVVNIYMLDSGGGSLPEQIDTTQIRWIRNISKANEKSSFLSSATLPGIAFQHIPSSLHDFQWDESRCSGMHDDGIAPVKKDAGIVNALSQYGNVNFLAVGHNHGNDYCCPIVRNDSSSLPSGSRESFHVCYGRHSGYGGYGNWTRGARVYELEFVEHVYHDEITQDVLIHKGPTYPHDNRQVSFSWRSWVRLETGEVVHRYDPTTTGVESSSITGEEGMDR